MRNAGGILKQAKTEIPMPMFVAKFHLKDNAVRTFHFGEFHQIEDIVNGEQEHGWGEPIDATEIEKVEIVNGGPSIAKEACGEVTASAA
jgi:hypothetical protein